MIYGTIVAAVAIVAALVAVIATTRSFVEGDTRKARAADAREEELRDWVLDALAFSRDERGDLLRALILAKEPIGYAAADRSINRARLAADQDDPRIAEALVEAERDTARLMDRMKGRRDSGMGEPASPYVDPETGDPVIPVGME